MTKHSDIVVVGAGPAGIAAAIAARKNGFRATVLDARTPPIDKPCGEGILPQGVSALRSLGISVPPDSAFPFRGIQFSDAESSVRAEFGRVAALSVRRVKLHQLLVDHAVREGVQFLWGARVTQLESHAVKSSQGSISYEWLVGADGQKSQVRKWAGLEPGVSCEKRFGFCVHFRLQPWSDVAEVHWGRGCQIFITPLAQQEVGVAVLSRDPHLRLEKALLQFPILAGKLEGATRTTKEWGDATALQSLRRVTRDRVALVGDASGSVDAITGHGLSLGFQQALALAEAMKRGNPALYESAHRRIATVAAAMSRLMLLMERHDSIRRNALRLFQSSPGLFSKMLAIHAGTIPTPSFRARELAAFSWKFLTA